MDRNVLVRIINSKKSILAMVPVTANMIAGFTGVDATQPVMLVVDGFFALLVGIQAVLDFKWGSPSDGSGTKG